MALSISGGDGGITSQARTQTPQASVGPSTNATSSRNVQSGTASSLLTTQSGGISLTSRELPTVTVAATPTTTHSVKPAPSLPQNQLDPILLGLPIILFIVAVIIFFLVARSAKTTTE